MAGEKVPLLDPELEFAIATVRSAGAIVLARLQGVVYGAADPKAGACDTLYQITSDGRLNHRAQVSRGVLADRCAEVLSAFFAGKRGRPQDP